MNLEDINGALGHNIGDIDILIVIFHFSLLLFSVFFLVIFVAFFLSVNDCTSVIYIYVFFSFSRSYICIYINTLCQMFFFLFFSFVLFLYLKSFFLFNVRRHFFKGDRCYGRHPHLFLLFHFSSFLSSLLMVYMRVIFFIFSRSVGYRHLFACACVCVFFFPFEIKYQKGSTLKPSKLISLPHMFL